MKQFIYVINEQSRDELLEAGFIMLKEELNNNTFIFKNEEDKEIPLPKNCFVLSDILVF